MIGLKKPGSKVRYPRPRALTLWGFTYRRKSDSLSLEAEEAGMSGAIAVARQDMATAELRAASGKAPSAPAARRMLAIALVLEGVERKTAAEHKERLRRIEQAA